MDYFSRFIEIAHLKSESSEEVIRQLKIILPAMEFSTLSFQTMVPSFPQESLSSFQTRITLPIGPAVPNILRQMEKQREP